MQKCAFCEFDYGEITLQEGRCPQCGSIVSWPEEPDSPNSASPEVLAQLQIPNTVPANDDKPLTTQGGSASPNDDSNGSRAHVKDSESQPVQSQIVQQPSSAPTSSVSPNQAGGSAVDPIRKQSVENLWRDSIESNANVYCTIKGANSEPTVSDSVFSILPREVRSPLHDIGNAPVDYELLDIIGQGGVGVVYTARQASIDRTVAIKMLREEYRGRNDHKEKFLAEAVLTGELDHPNIVPIYDLGRNSQGELFYSMKNVIGTPWDRVIAQKTLRENIDILLKVADAVAFAHSRSVVHRDLKPENVMLGSFGEVLVMDWGIAVPTEGFRRTTNILRSQAMGGTPAYMAPELATGPVDSIGPPADVYLLGAILFEILTGSPPHYGSNVMECVQNAAENVIRETTVTGELMEIAIRAMATNPRRRFRSVQSFQAAIRLYQSHSESIMLSDSADAELTQAIATKDYKGYSRAVFAFEESLSLWNENESAQLGLSRAKIAYATAALEKGDFDLGLTMLDESEFEHQQLIKKLKAALLDRNARQNRLRTIKKLAAMLGVFIIVAGTIALTVILSLYNKASELNNTLDKANLNLEKEFQRTSDALAEAKTQRTLAVEASKTAEEKRAEAESARRNAELSRLESVAQKQRAEESSYFAEIGLVGASIQQNQFSIASDVLNSQEKSAAKSKIRHWEWGRHRYVVRGGSTDDAIQTVSSYPTNESVESIDCSPDGGWIAIGMATGEIELWRRGQMQPTARFRHGRSLTDLDFDVSGSLIATSGNDENNTGAVILWKIEENGSVQFEKKLATKGSTPTTVIFSNDPKSQWLATGDNKRTGRIWRWRDEIETNVLLGHIDTLTSIDISPNNEWVATASADGSVRVWNLTTGSEVQRFLGHEAVVLAVAFSPDSKMIASGGADRRVLLWDVVPRDERIESYEDAVKQVRGLGETIPPQPFRAMVGHNGTVQDLGFSHDGTKIVSSANDNVVCIWNLETRTPTETIRPEFRLRGHGGWVRACRFLANGDEVVSGGDDRTWRSWRYKNYREKQVLGDGRNPITDARYSPTDNLIAAAHADGAISLWNSISNERIAVLSDGHEYLTNRARATPDNKYLATSAGDNSLRLWDIQRGTQVAMLENAGRNGHFTISSNGKWLVAGGDDNGVAVWSIEAMQLVRRFREAITDGKEASSTNPDAKKQDPLRERAKSNRVTAVAISGSGEHVVVGDKNGAIEFWDADRNQMRSRILGHSEAVIACFFLDGKTSANPDTVLTVSSDGSAAWWDFSTGKEMPRERLAHFAAIQLASISADGSYLACSASIDQGNSRLWVWDLQTSAKIATKELSGELPQDITFTTVNAPTVYLTTSGLADSKKRTRRWDARSSGWDEIRSERMITDSLWGVLPLANDSQLISYGGRGARLWRAADGQELRSYRPLTSLSSIAFSHSGKLLASASDDGSALVWDVEKRRSMQKLVAGHSGAIRDIVFSADDTSVLTTGSDGRIVLWNAFDGSQIQTGKITESGVIGNSVRLSPDGKSFVVGCDDNNVRVYDMATMELTQKLSGHAASVTCASFSLDGRLIVSGSADKSIRVWSIASGRELAKLLGHSAALTSVAFSSDGLRVLSASQDTTARLWDLDRIAQLGDPSTEASASPNAESEAMGADLGEVLSLEVHTREATIAEFSVDGRSILTAGMDGQIVLWPSERVPPSLRVSNPNVSYKLGSTVKRLDPMMVLSHPGTEDLLHATLHVQLESPAAEIERVSIDVSDTVFQIVDSRLIYLPGTKSEKDIGRIELDSKNLGFTVQFNNNVTHESATKLLRRISFTSDATEQPTELAPRIVMIELADRLGNKGNSHSESITVNLTKE